MVQREARGLGGGGYGEWGVSEKADMLMVLTSESPGFASRNVTESVQWLFFQPFPVNAVKFVCTDAT